MLLNYECYAEFSGMCMKNMNLAYRKLRDDVRLITLQTCCFWCLTSGFDS
jgi:hypothetical protein